MLGAADVHVARRLGRLGGETDERVLLAVGAGGAGAAARVGVPRRWRPRGDHRGARTSTADDRGGAAAGRSRRHWLAALRRSPLVAVGADGDPPRPLRLVERRCSTSTATGARSSASRRARRARRAGRARRWTAARLRDGARPAVPRPRRRTGSGSRPSSRTHRWVSVLAGGPGTGKTTTVARLLALLARPGRRCAAGRARRADRQGRGPADRRRCARRGRGASTRSTADRLGGLEASTLHRLLGWRPGSAQPVPPRPGQPAALRRRRRRRDVDGVADDDGAAARGAAPRRRLVLVGDPDQLASVDAGAVLGDLVARPAPAVRPCASAIDGAGPGRRRPTSAADERVRAATAVSCGSRTCTGSPSAIAVAGRGGAQRRRRPVARGARAGGTPTSSSSTWTRRRGRLRALQADVVSAGVAVHAAARPATPTGRCAARAGTGCSARTGEGPYGVAQWSRRAEDWLRAAITGYAAGGRWYVGRPLLVTANDYELRLFNGDTGVVVDVRRRGPVRPSPRQRRSSTCSRPAGCPTCRPCTR